MTKGSHRCDRVQCRKQATDTVVTGAPKAPPKYKILAGLELLLCKQHRELWDSGQWFKGLPA